MSTRTCPACSAPFKKGKRVDNIPHCPHCGVALFYPEGKLKGKTLLYADKVAVKQAVEMLEKHLSARRDFEVHFEGAEKYKEYAIAYELLKRCKNLFSTPKYDLGIQPSEFLIAIVEHVLSDPFWSNLIRSLATILKRAIEFATETWKEIKKQQIDLARQQRDLAPDHIYDKCIPSMLPIPNIPVLAHAALNP